MLNEIDNIKHTAFHKTNLTKKTNKYTHTCTLPPKEDLVVTFITSGYFVTLRRFLKKYVTINENSKYARECFKSSKQVENEMKRHLKYYYIMIHPFSRLT